MFPWWNSRVSSIVGKLLASSRVRAAFVRPLLVPSLHWELVRSGNTRDPDTSRKRAKDRYSNFYSGKERNIENVGRYANSWLVDIFDWCLRSWELKFIFSSSSSSTRVILLLGIKGRSMLINAQFRWPLFFPANFYSFNVSFLFFFHFKSKS